MLDDFDSLLVKNFESKENCGYLCSMVSDYAEKFNALKHASISNGICSSEALAKVWERFGQLPHRYFYEIANADNDIYGKFNAITDGNGQFILEMFTEGFSIKRICKKLNMKSIPASEKGGWNYVMLRKFLKILRLIICQDHWQMQKKNTLLYLKSIFHKRFMFVDMKYTILQMNIMFLLSNTVVDLGASLRVGIT